MVSWWDGCAVGADNGQGESSLSARICPLVLPWTLERVREPSLCGAACALEERRCGVRACSARDIPLCSTRDPG